MEREAYDAACEEEERRQSVNGRHDQTLQRFDEDGGDADEGGEHAPAAREGGIVDRVDRAENLALDQADREAEDDGGADELDTASGAIDEGEHHFREAAGRSADGRGCFSGARSEARVLFSSCQAVR